MNEHIKENIELMMMAIRSNDETLKHLEDFLHDFTMDSAVNKTVTLELMNRVRSIEDEQEKLASELIETVKNNGGIASHEVNNFLIKHNLLFT